MPAIQNNPSEMALAALAYCKQDGCRPALKIFPVGKDKKPLIADWPNKATSDEKTIKDWWTRWPDANIAMATAGFVVIDIDEHDPAASGSESLHDLELQYGELPDTPEQMTPSGGRHIILQYKGTDITVGTGLAPGIDWRGNGGYVVIAPSVLADGRSYEWEAGHDPRDTPLAELPGWLHDLIVEKRTARSSQGPARAAPKIELPETIPKGERNDTLFRMACSLREKNLTEDEMLVTLKEMNRTRCDPQLTERELKQIASSAAKYDPGDLPKLPQDYRPPDLSDAGNAEAFTKTVKGRMLWCDALGWLCWDGMRFAQNDHAATALAIEWAQRLLDYATEQYRHELRTDPDTGKIVVSEATKKLLQHAQKTRSAVSIQNFMNLSKAYLHIRADQLDSQWWSLNTPAGIVDLRTGKTGPHDPTALFTTITKCSPSDENMEMWTTALDIASCHDSAWIDYDNMTEGSMLFGKIFKEGILIKKGPGRNMKSTLTNAALQVLGDYGGTIDSAILTTDRQNRGAALATLRGKRMVVCGELEEGQRLSVATLKKLASTDPLTIEAKYKQPETINPSHHLILYTNFLPRVGSTDTGTWRRISVLPYDATIPEGDGDIPNYADELVNKAGGAILKWLIDGAVKFFQAGCRIDAPECVRQATEDYRAGEDWLQGFISERCIVDRDAKERAGVLYDEYKDYAVSIGDYCRRATDFVKAMELAGFRSVTVNGKKYWLGISINYAESSSASSRVS
ncbi:MAG: bifunctional DNA primase/polymerase [Oscillospiraceae bacterium]|nr:bifunctional DNA primase/polymerase [Oscillospiraceae bacterium]